MKDKLRSLGLPLLLCLLISAFYTLPTFRGKIHSQSDVNQGLLSMTEAKKYEKQDGKLPYWTNSIFSGMPTTLIIGRPSDNLIAKFNLIFTKTLYPYRIMVVNMVGFMILLLAFRVNPWLALGGSLAYAFATYSISSIEAAHYTKCLAMGVMPAILGGLIMILNRNYLWGLFTMAFSLSLQIYYFHYQITFYTLVILLVFGLFYAVYQLKQKAVTHVLLGGLLAVGAGALGVGTNIVKLKSTSDYSSQSMRGGSALAGTQQQGAEENSGSEVSGEGLNMKYAFDWSYGIGESISLFIPGYVGRSSNEDLGEGSFYDGLIDAGMDRANAKSWASGAPMYFGDMPFTSGPVYIGAAVFLLFILGLFVVKDAVRWPILITLAISLFLAWGRHFPLLNEWLFENLPYYNKFRTPMMALTIAQVMIPLLGILGLQRWMSDDIKMADKWEQLKKTGIVAGGLVLLFGLIGSFARDFEAARDGELLENLRRNGAESLYQVILDGRAGLVRSDSLRSLLFMALMFGALWMWMKGRLKHAGLYAAVLVVGFLDLGTIAWHYLGWDDYKFKYRTEPLIEMTQADEQIMKDADPHYRVFELTPDRDPFSSNRGAKFHKLINGYHPAKLSVYQDLILNHLGKNNEKVLDMLNCKYFIGYDKSGGTMAQRRQTALGNAWFVDSLVWVSNPKAEIDALANFPQFDSTGMMTGVIGSFEPARYAVAQQLWPETKTDNHVALGKQTTYQRDSSASVKLTAYHPDKLQYSSNSAHEGIVVFSELAYPGWKATIDGKEVPLGRVNYALRALKVPAGQHQIVMEYTDPGGSSLGKLELAGSALILLLLPAAWLYGRRRKEEEANA